jgi:hypothetical protein
MAQAFAQEAKIRKIMVRSLPYLEKNSSPKKAGGMAQGVGRVQTSVWIANKKMQANLFKGQQQISCSSEHIGDPDLAFYYFPLD